MVLSQLRNVNLEIDTITGYLSVFMYCHLTFTKLKTKKRQR